MTGAGQHEKVYVSHADFFFQSIVQDPVIVLHF